MGCRPKYSVVFVVPFVNTCVATNVPNKKSLCSRFSTKDSNNFHSAWKKLQNSNKLIFYTLSVTFIFANGSSLAA